MDTIELCPSLFPLVGTVCYPLGVIAVTVPVTVLVTVTVGRPIMDTMLWWVNTHTHTHTVTNRETLRERMAIGHALIDIGISRIC